MCEDQCLLKSSTQSTEPSSTSGSTIATPFDMEFPNTHQQTEAGPEHLVGPLLLQLFQKLISSARHDLCYKSTHIITFQRVSVSSMASARSCSVMLMLRNLQKVGKYFLNLCHDYLNAAILADIFVF